MKTFVRISSAVVFTISFICMLSFNGDELWKQIVWTLSWMVVCGISGRIFGKYINKTN